MMTSPYGSGPDVVSETTFDSASVKPRAMVEPAYQDVPKRKRGRPPKPKPQPEPTNDVPEVTNPVAYGTPSDILKSNVQIPGEFSGYGERRPTVEYHICVASRPDELKVNVNDMLRNGWELAGSLSVSNGLLYQAIKRVT